eukprot:97793-Chlamydomonas_euryale.AAC.1
MDLPTQALSEMFNCNHFVVSQANPHLVPLLHLKRALPGCWGSVVEAEFKHRCHVAQLTAPHFARPAARLLSLFTQPWTGDITMMLPLSLHYGVNPMINPDAGQLAALLHMGELAGWEKLSAIECNCSVEATLDACMAA